MGRIVVTMPIGMEDESERIDRLWPLAGLALLGGVLIGGVGAAFRYGLSWSDTQRTALIEHLHQWPWIGWTVPVLLAAVCAAIARWFVRYCPLAAGSGVQHVEAVMRGEAVRAPLSVLPVKFFGGLLAIGSGLALGREGPTVQMGATIGSELADRFKLSVSDLRDLQAALAGAGLGVAFNAPVGGAMFVFEEVSRSFRLRLTLATLLGAAMALAVSRLILGDAPDFDVSHIRFIPFVEVVPYFVFGLLLGALGVTYNSFTVRCMDVIASLRSWPVEWRAALVGAFVGVVGWFLPEMIGGGDPLNQKVLLGTVPLGLVAVGLFVRWILGPVSYAAGTPGGLFAPLLLVGSIVGVLFAAGLNVVMPESLAVQPAALAVVGMAAFFTAVVRAPLTGIILITEMTATTGLLVPMMVSCFAATLAATILKGPPVYDTLRERMLASGIANPSRGK